MHMATPRYRPSDPVDFLIVGAGAAGGVLARELSVKGFRVVVLEQGPYLREKDFRHDEVDQTYRYALVNDPRIQPQTFRSRESEPSTRHYTVQYGRMVGGGITHFTGNFWRFHEIDFVEASRRGTVAGTGLADWPITYQDLEPWYTKAEWDMGVSGEAGTSPFDPPHSKPYPLPPMPLNSCGALTQLGARKLGWHAFPAPLAILSRPYQGRSGCIECGFCEGFGCEVRAKSTTLATMIPEAEATGRCEIRPDSYVRRIATDRQGRATGAIYFDRHRREVFQRAKAVIVCANGAETPRLLLMSASSQFPDGLANSSGLVGKYLLFNGYSVAGGLFEHEVNGHRGFHLSHTIHDFYELDPSVGLSGGGGLEFRFDAYPIFFAQAQLPPDAPRWGAEFKRLLGQYYTHSVIAETHTTTLPLETNTITLDPTLKDDWGLPAMRVTYSDHENDLKLMTWMQDRSVELLDAAGAVRRWRAPLDNSSFAQHLLGTCRMGDDPKTSVTDKSHRAHDVPNLFICSGASFVTGGRGQPTETICALAFRAADEIVKLARSGALGA